MRKILLLLILPACLLFSVVIVNAEESDEREWQKAMGGSFSFSGNSDSNDDNHEDESKEIHPAPQPTLDLPLDRVFYITTLLISLVVMFTTKRPLFYL